MSKLRTGLMFSMVVLSLGLPSLTSAEKGEKALETLFREIENKAVPMESVKTNIMMRRAAQKKYLFQSWEAKVPDIQMEFSEEEVLGKALKFPSLAGIGGYTLSDDRVISKNVGGKYNKMLYGNGGYTYVYAGDRPVFRLASAHIVYQDGIPELQELRDKIEQRGGKKIGVFGKRGYVPNAILGDIQVGIASKRAYKYLHEFNHIEAVYQPRVYEYILEDSLFPGLKVVLGIVPFCKDNGVILKLSMTSKQNMEDVEIFYTSGGIKYNALLAPANVLKEDLNSLTKDDEVKISQKQCFVSDKLIPEVVLTCASTIPGTWRTADSTDMEKRESGNSKAVRYQLNQTTGEITTNDGGSLIKQWLALGDFEGGSLGEDYIQEAKAAPETGKEMNGRIWKKHTAEGQCLDFQDNDLFGKKNNTLAYAAAYVYSTEEQDADLCLGSDDGCKVWVNGGMVYCTGEITRGLLLDRDVIPIKLKKGVNLLLFKVQQKTGAWKLSARVVAGAGKPLILSQSQAKENPIGVYVSQPLTLMANETHESYLVWRWDYTWRCPSSPDRELEKIVGNPKEYYEESQRYFKTIRDRVTIETPIDALNQAVPEINSLCDCLWRDNVHNFVHDPYCWIQTEFLWKVFGGPIVFGWHDRIKSALRKNVYPMGTGQYLYYIYQYYCWTGDKKYIEEIWPEIEKTLKHMEQDEAVPGTDLYLSDYMFWVDDGVYHHGVTSTISGFYSSNYRDIAEMAKAIGKDPAPYLEKAKKIREAVMAKLWFKKEGFLAEYVDPLDVIHPVVYSPGIYWPILTDFLDEKEAYLQLKQEKKHLRVCGMVASSDFEPMQSSNGALWISLPETLHMLFAYQKTGQVDEAWKLMLPCLQVLYNGNRPGDWAAFLNPGENKAQPFEAWFYTDFGQASVFGQMVVEGLFGIQPRMQDAKVTITPNFPRGWDSASIKTPTVGYVYKRSAEKVTLTTTSTIPLRKNFRIPFYKGIKVMEALINGKKADYKIIPGIGRTLVVVEDEQISSETRLELTVNEIPYSLEYPKVVPLGKELAIKVKGVSVEGVEDPQVILNGRRREGDADVFKIKEEEGEYTLFLKVRCGEGLFLYPIDFQLKQDVEITGTGIFWPNRVYYFMLSNNTGKDMAIKVWHRFLGADKEEPISLPAFSEETLLYPLSPGQELKLFPGSTPLSVKINGDVERKLQAEVRDWQAFNQLPGNLSKSKFNMIDISAYCNIKFSEMFLQKYRNASQPSFQDYNADLKYKLGQGGWCPRANGMPGGYYTVKAAWLGTEYMQKGIKDGVYTTDIGIPFLAKGEEKDAVLVSLWKTFPKEVRVKIGRKGNKAYLLIAGSCMNMNYKVPNGSVGVHYEDGSTATIMLVPPENYDYLLEKPFSIEPYHQMLNEHTHANLMEIPLNPQKNVQEISLRAETLDTVIGLLGITLLEAGEYK